MLNPNNHDNHSFHNTFDYNHFIYSDYLLYSQYTLMSICDIIVTMKIKAIQMFKYNNGNIPKALTELFTLNSSNHSYNTRNKGKIR